MSGLLYSLVIFTSLPILPYYIILMLHLMVYKPVKAKFPIWFFSYVFLNLMVMFTTISTQASIKINTVSNTVANRELQVPAP